MIISGTKCKWGKCNFCGYATIKKTDIQNIDKIKNDLINEILECRPKNENVFIMNSGSFLNDEVPSEIKELILSTMEEMKYFNLTIENRFDQIDWDYMESIIKRGFNLTIAWGFESSNEQKREFINKGIQDNETILSLLDRAHKMGVKNLLYLMAGLPKMTEDEAIDADFKESIRWVVMHKNLVDELICLTFVPINGTPFYKDLWITDKHREIGLEEWRGCREFVAKRLPNMSVGYETMYWRYIHGKTYSEAYKKKK